MTKTTREDKPNNSKMTKPIEKKEKYTNKDLREKFVMSLQFYYDYDYGSICLQLCINKTKYKLDDFFSMGVIGATFGRTKLLNKKEKSAFRQFCISFINNSGGLVKKYKLGL